MKYHIIYKTTHKNGKYYVGRHSTENLNDGYIGSGLWPSSIKDKSSVTREILEFADDEEQLKKLEGVYLLEHVGNPNCMNYSVDPIGFDSKNNPMKNPEVASKISGENHYMRKDPTARENSRIRQNNRVEQGIHNLQGDRNPNKDGQNAKVAMERGTHINLTNNPSKWRSEQGIHHWQNGNSPNKDGKVNAKRIANGTHNLVGPEHNKRMIAEGKNPWVGPDANRKRLEAGTHPSQQKKTCEHCGKESSIAMYKRWHGANCRSLKETK